jgi:hypothetical protein
MRKLLSLLPITLVMMTVTTAKALADAPGMSWTWRESRLSHSQCVAQADAAIRDSGFNNNVEAVGTAPDISTFGTNDDYRTAIRCITNKKLVLFLVTGDGSDSGKLQSRLVNNFLGE